MTIPTVCASRPLRFNHPAIFIHRLPRAWWNISGSHCAILINFSVHAVLHKMSKIPILRQSLYIDCGRSSFRGAAQNWPCRQKSGFTGYLLSMPLAIFMHRLLMIILRTNYYFFIGTMRKVRLTHKETERCASVYFPVWAHAMFSTLRLPKRAKLIVY